MAPPLLLSKVDFSIISFQALTYSEDYPEAIEVFTEALRLDPRSNLVRLALQRAKTAWKVQRDRQIRALSRAFKVNGVTENKLQKSGVGFVSTRMLLL